MRRILLFLCLSALAVACRKDDPLYCDEKRPCAAGHPFCDLNGACEQSGFVSNTCIPEACWDAGAAGDTDAAQADAMPDAAGEQQPDAQVSELSPWGDPVEVHGLSSQYHDIGPTISSDGLEMFIYRTGEVNGGSLKWATRPFVGVGWADIRTAFVSHRFPELSPDGRELFTTKSGKIHLFERSQAGGEDWDTGTELFEGAAPRLAAGGLVIYYSLDEQLQRRERSTLQAEWGPPEDIPLPSLDGEYLAIAVSDDERLAIVTAVVNGELTLQETMRSSVQQMWEPFERIGAFDELGSAGVCDLWTKSKMFCGVTDVNGSGDIYYVARTN